MKFILTLLFSFYASLDGLILTTDSLSIRKQLIISSLASFFTVIGIQLGAWCIPFLDTISTEEIVTIALLFLILYYLDFNTKPYVLFTSLLHSQHHSASVLGVLLAFNNLGFGILAGLQTLSIFWMPLFSFLFSGLFLQKSFSVTKTHLIVLLIIMILCINAL